MPRRRASCAGCGAAWVPHRRGKDPSGLPERVADRHALLDLPAVGVALILGFAENC